VTGDTELRTCGSRGGGGGATCRLTVWLPGAFFFLANPASLLIGSGVAHFA